MENASKALIMAGSILIALLIISILVFGYNQLSSVEQEKANSEDNKKMAEYLRRFEQFNRNETDPLYGSELLSLANLQDDYNKLIDLENSGYEKIIIMVNIDDPIVGSNEYFQQGNRSLEDILDDKNALEEEMEEYEEPKTKYKNKSVKYYYSKRNSYREIAYDFGIEVPSNMPSYEIATILEQDPTVGKLLEEIQEYTNLRSTYNEFKTGRRFACTNVEYNRYSGRVEKMYFDDI